MLSPGEVPRGGGGHRLATRVGRAALFVLGAAAAVYGTWLACNLVDSPARPLPEALAAPPAREPGINNLHVRLAGVLFSGTSTTAEAGVAAWKDQQALAQAMHRRERPLDVPRGRADSLPVPSGAPWTCAPDSAETPNCVAAWWTRRDDLQAQRSQAAPWGARCDEALAPGIDPLESWPEPMNFASPWTAPLQAASACLAWWHTGAALALQAGDRAAALTALARAQELTQALSAGSRSLLLLHFSQRLVQRHLLVMNALALRDPSLSPDLLPWLDPAPDPLAGQRRAAVYEFHYGHAAMRQLRPGDCGRPDPALQSPPPRAPASLPWWQRSLLALEEWHCTVGAGLLPEATAQQLAQRLMAQMQQIDRHGTDWAAWSGMQAAVPSTAPASTLQEAWRATFGTAWRNGRGALLIQLGEEDQAAARDALRVADLDLLRTAVRLTLLALRDNVPAEQRAAWSRAQEGTAAHRDRLAWEDDGQTLVARGWAGAGASGLLRARDVRWTVSTVD
jgi:hypothetical protein